LLVERATTSGREPSREPSVNEATS
jgi:hypothetical protein